MMSGCRNILRIHIRHPALFLDFSCFGEKTSTRISRQNKKQALSPVVKDGDGYERISCNVSAPRLPAETNFVKKGS